MINQKIFKKWFRALESGKYRKCKGALHKDNNTFCAWGVLCDIYAKEKKEEWNLLNTHKTILGESDSPPHKILKWAGIPDALDFVDTVIDLNDDKGYSFKRIVKTIKEKYLPILKLQKDIEV